MQTLLLPSDRKLGICYRMAPLRMLYIMTFYIFKVTNFEIWISRKIWELAKNVQAWLWLMLIFAVECDHCAYCCLWPLPKFSRSNLSSGKAREYKNYYLSSDRKSGICHRMALLRLMYIMTLTHIFRVMHFEMWISLKRSELAKMF